MTSTAKAVDSGIDKKTLVRALLYERQEKCRQNPDLIVTDPWSLSSVWYLLEPQFKTLGLAITDSTRKMVQNEYVLDICRNELRCTRASIGIFAAPRGTYYYNEEARLVTLDSADELGDKGTDLVVIEKQAPAMAFSKLAAKNGIAILSTGGFLTETNIDYGALVQERGGNASILHDIDASGIAIKLKVPGIVDLGLDFEFLEELGIDPDRVTQPTQPNGHWQWLQKNCPPDHAMYPHLQWLATNKIEIDHVMAVAGARNVWDVILNRLSRQFPTRDYTRAYDVMRDYTQPPFMREFDNEVMDSLAASTRDLDEEIADELSAVEGIKELSAIKGDAKSRRLKTYRQNAAYGRLQTRVENLTRWVKKQQWAKGGMRRS